MEARLPRLHPNLAELYRKKIERLEEELQSDVTREEAVEILQQMIDSVTVRWRDDAFEIELIGEIANMVALSSRDGGTATSGFRRSVKVVEEAVSCEPVSS